MTQEDGKKDEEITIKQDGKIVTVGQRDYRGLMAVSLVVGEIILLVKGDMSAASVLGPLTGAAVGWYFGGSRKEEGKRERDREGE